MNDDFNPQRRRLVAATLSAGALVPWTRLSFAASAGTGANRFVMVILRGGMDGLSAVPAIGDPDFAAARGALAQFTVPPLALDSGFALHPQLAQLHAMYGRSELVVVHAVGLPYRERSHFDAQQVLESGGTRPHELATGWLGRALGSTGGKGLALDTSVPLVLRGPGTVDTWAASVLPDPSPDLVSRLEPMYANDAALAGALARAKALHFDPAMTASLAGMPAGNALRPGGLAPLAQRAAEFLSQANGPQAAVLEVGGWDTHANQAAPNGALANNLRNLDAGLAALRDGLVASQVWRQTVVVVATEFGREVAINGTQGTDHGSAGAAFVLGGAVAGGRMLADWPGLARRERFEGRDLRTTLDLRAVLKGVLSDHLGLSTAALSRDVFPGGDGVKGVALLR
ncbi:DUF1501 domain-containing protein [Piscinibacter sp.]|uniref:DUF1501 domain-containing protein n=1 Tax=Piscinibacter sp. TaxID=1903157 RepID=UPI002F40EA01